MQHNKERTSEIIKVIIKNATIHEHVTIGSFVHTLGERAFGLAVLLFALPNSIPIFGIPGFSSITGFPIIIFGLQMALGKTNPWLPKAVYNYQFSQKKLAFILDKTTPVLSKIERIIKPRLVFMLTPLAERFIGVAFFILGVILAMPIPFGNFLPGLSLSILALGLIEGDGLIIIIGMISGLISSTIISATIIILIQKLIIFLQHLI